ncbi:YdeI/OmpD-associated family protein [Algoriphagus halophytocola]|uniref:DUF1801 domain-containing protein n=1 Tax=Algoriphagus halophytocola TaxID=2991499 RepID=A0ABY6MFR4_9BACT|nr:DUF1801 domain-containing protein [Algoriphagus sp. TR-M5]UZD22647.1 DUF1801 domain-containing protein [Algoriphagus sp. TR-M5]
MPKHSKNSMPSSVEEYLSEGCGRCPLGGTPDCKVHPWSAELTQLRKLVLQCGLQEEIKWGVPCYSWKEGNILLLSALKEYTALSFFKGALLKDSKKILQKPGKNTQAGRLLKFTSLSQIHENQETIKAYIFEAIELEKAGLKVELKTNPEPIPREFQDAMEQDSTLKNAFEALTPGRKRGYILYFSAPKQSKTRIARIEKYRAKILDGKGFHDR